MPGLVTDRARSGIMARVKQRGTSEEKAVAELCRQLGLTYRLNVRSLPGSPDLASKKNRWAIFVNGCFWHRHDGCAKATLPKRNADFWREKLDANRRRDARNIAELQRSGFTVLTIWGCEFADPARVRQQLQALPKRADRIGLSQFSQMPRPQ